MRPNVGKKTSSIARLADEIRLTGYNREMFIEAGIVVSEAPELKIEIDEDIILDADDLVIAEHLTRHTREALVNGVTSTIEFTDELSLGDRVMIISDDDTDEYFVIDRVVEYDVTE